MYQIWAWSGYDLVKFRSIKKHFWISKDDFSIHPSVILQLLMSPQRSSVIAKDTFWYLKMMSASTHQWYFSWLFHIKKDKLPTDWSNFLLGPHFSHFEILLPWSSHFQQRFFYGSKMKNMSFCTGIYKISTRKKAKSRKESVIKWRSRPF